MSTTSYSIGSVRQHFNLAKALKYNIAELGLLLLIPFSAFSWSPLYSFLGGLISGLLPHQIFWMSICLCVSSWSLMYSVGLVFEGKVEGESARRYPAWAYKHFGVPVNWGQFLSFTGLALPGLIIMIAKMDTGRWAAGGLSVLGVFLSYFLMILAASLARFASNEYRAIPGNVPEAFWKLIGAERFAVFGLRLLAIVSWVPCKARLFGHILEMREMPDGSRKKLLKLDHYFAFTNTLFIVFIFALGAYLFYPFRESYLSFTPPALSYFYVFIILMVWALSFLDYHFSRYEIPPVLVALAYIFAIYGAFQSDLFRGVIPKVDHYFYVFPEQTAEGAVSEKVQPLTPVDVVKASKRGRNLVVVTATGGGIQAAGWITYSLHQLIDSHGVKLEDIRLLSTVSGGSVGAAFFLNGKMQEKPKKGSVIYRESVRSSLAPITYAMAFRDFWMTALGPLALWVGDEDRGMMLEKSWALNAHGRADSTVPSLGGLKQAILDGRIPAPILNATTMETGRRIMATPLSLEERLYSDPVDATSVERDRAQTLYELLTTPKEAKTNDEQRSMRNEMDMGLWTAARLSASFSYVSPASLAKFDPSKSSGSWDVDNLRGFHLIDGGYFDNYGVASALDFLEPVMKRKLEGDDELKFERVMIIQLRSSSVAHPSENEPSSGFIAAVAGPELGILNIRDGIAISRNELECRRFIENWNKLFELQGVDVKLDTVVFEPDRSDLPLSWHLSQKQKDELTHPWTEPTDAFKHNLDKLKRFLK